MPDKGKEVVLSGKPKKWLHNLYSYDDVQYAGSSFVSTTLDQVPKRCMKNTLVMLMIFEK